MNTNRGANSTPDEAARRDRPDRRRFLRAAGATAVAAGAAGCAGLPGLPGGRGDVEVEVSPEPVPGRRVTVTTTRNDSPVEGVLVSVGDARVGRTNANGQVAFRVPYVETLELTARKDGRATEREYDLPTDVDIAAVDGDPVPGETTTLRATIDDVPVSDARVETDHGSPGETGDDGRVDVAVPYAESLEVTVTRGEASGEREFDLGAGLRLSLADEPPVPGTTTTVEVTANGSPVPDALVRVATADAELTAKRTDEDGRVVVPVPVANVVTISARRGDASAKRTYESLLSDITVSLVDGPPIPGTTVTVEATASGAPLSGATVRVADADGSDGEGDKSASEGSERGERTDKGGNGQAGGKKGEDEDRDDGEVVGTTDESGRLDVPVGYVSTLVVTVSSDDASGSATFDVPTGISLAVDGRLREGRDATFTAAIRGVPVPGAAVRINDTTVGKTDDAGAVTYAVPRGTDKLAVAATRGDASGERTFDVNSRESGGDRDRGVGRDR